MDVGKSVILAADQQSIACGALAIGLNAIRRRLEVHQSFVHFLFFQAEDGIRDLQGDWSSDVCSSDLSMQLHFWAPVELVSQVVPKMWSGGGGRIVNISSIGGKIAVPHMAPYTASKFALTGFSDAIRAELARYKIHVTTVTPGMMRTGSQVHAKFKGDHSAEQKWFAASNAL